jgi:hypothetical protein
MTTNAEISKWAITQAQREVSCPRCGARQKRDCRTPKGRVIPTIHDERIGRYRSLIGNDEWKRRHEYAG